MTETEQIDNCSDPDATEPHFAPRQIEVSCTRLVTEFNAAEASAD
jgi:hypothetical protein